MSDHVATLSLAFCLGLPMLGGMWLLWQGHTASAPRVNIGISAFTLIFALALASRLVNSDRVVMGEELFSVDALNIIIVVLTALVGFTTALYSPPYLKTELDRGNMTPRRLRLFFGMYQLFMGMMLLALTCNNLGVMWVAMEAATLSTVMLVSVYRTPKSVEAAWKYFILCGVGIAQALFGTLLLYLAADRVLHGAEGALLWTHLAAVKSQLEPNVVALAFAFLLLGYGTKVGLVPIHNWLPDAHAEGPTPISAILSGLLLNVALYAILRCKILADAALGSALPGHIMIAFGILTAVVAAFFLFQQKDIKRLFAYSSIEHMGIMSLSFGLGGTMAAFAGLLHMIVHAITKSAIFFAVGNLTQAAGTQVIEDMRGLVRRQPALAWCLMLGTLAILGTPPFGAFASEFLLLTQASHLALWTVPCLLLTLALAFAAVIGKVQNMVFGECSLPKGTLPRGTNITPIVFHLILSLALGLYLPDTLRRFLSRAGDLLSGLSFP